VDDSTRANGWREPKDHADTFDSSVEVLDGEPAEMSTNVEGQKPDKGGFNTSTVFHSV